jgi:hypothetical protein
VLMENLLLFGHRGQWISCRGHSKHFNIAGRGCEGT